MVGCHSGVGVESDNDAIETDWRFFGVLPGGKPAVSPTYLTKKGQRALP